MNHEERIISVYVTLEEAYKAVLGNTRVRRCGEAPALSDVEHLTVEVFGEMQGHHTDAAIWRYAKQHWQAWFPTLGSYPAFAKQSANLAALKQRIFAYLFAPQDDVHITDGVPMPVCHYVRAGRCKSFRGDAAFGFCAAKDEYYYGFKGHVMINLRQQVMGFTLAPANIDERDVLDNIRGAMTGLIIGDKGLLSESKRAELAEVHIDLQTPLRDNMRDPRPKSCVQRLLKVRRRVETAIGQLVDFFGFAKCKTRDIWHLTAKLLRKLIAYNLSLA
jgi:hypothetical protein